LIRDSLPMRNLIAQAAAAARTSSTVLIVGETGTGKELVAQAIHDNSVVAGGPFVAVNCAAIPEPLFESELFGHEKGAFTGAVNTKLGEFELASGGTLFLDEVGELPQIVQAKLLRVLQQREFKRVGGTRTLHANVRIIAATNRDLRTAFREDLYYRLNVIPIDVPSLRERSQDIPALAHHFLFIYGRQSTREIRGISNEGETALKIYSWPGNVRELQNIMERAVMMGSSSMLEPADFPVVIKSAALDFETGLAAAKRSLVERAFAAADGHIETASSLLKLNRNYVYSLLKELNLTHLRRRNGSIDGYAL